MEEHNQYCEINRKQRSGVFGACEAEMIGDCRTDVLCADKISSVRTSPQLYVLSLSIILSPLPLWLMLQSGDEHDMLNRRGTYA